MASSLQKYVECPVCFNLLQGPQHQPLALACMHTLCKDCYSRMKKPSGIVCPMCQRSCDLKLVKQDFRAESLVDDYLRESTESERNGLSEEVRELTQRLESVLEITEERCGQLQAKLDKIGKIERKALRKMKTAEEKIIRKVQEHFGDLRSQVENAKEPLCQRLDVELEAENHRRTKIEACIRNVGKANGGTVKSAYELLKSLEVLEDPGSTEFSVNIIEDGADSIANVICLNIKATYQGPSGSWNNETIQPLCPTAPPPSDNGACESPTYEPKPQVRKKKPLTIARSKTLPNMKERHGKSMPSPLNSDRQGPLFVRSAEAEIEGVATRLFQYKEELWVCTSSDLYLFTMDCKLVKKVATLGINDVRSFVKVDNTSFAVLDFVSKKRSLKLLNKDGHCTKTISSGQFSDICFYNHMVYALDHERQLVHSFRQISGNNNWQEYHQIHLLECDSIELDTFCIVRDNIFISSSSSHSVLVFSMSGRLMGRFGSGSTGGVNDKRAGFLKYPRVCGEFSWNKALIGDCFNERLQVLSLDGTWTIMNIEDQYGTIWDAVLDGKNLFVLHFFGRKYHIVKYKTDV